MKLSRIGTQSFGVKRKLLTDNVFKIYEQKKNKVVIESPSCTLSEPGDALTKAIELHPDPNLVDNNPCEPRCSGSPLLVNLLSWNVQGLGKHVYSDCPLSCSLCPLLCGKSCLGWPSTHFYWPVCNQQFYGIFTRDLEVNWHHLCKMFIKILENENLTGLT